MYLSAQPDERDAFPTGSPSALPSFASGLELGQALCWRSLTAGDLLVILPGTTSIGARM